MATKLTKRVRRVTEEKHVPYNETAVKILGVKADGSINSVPNEGRPLIIELLPGKTAMISIRYLGLQTAYTISAINLLYRLQNESMVDIQKDLSRKKMGMTKRMRRKSTKEPSREGTHISGKVNK